MAMASIRTDGILSNRSQESTSSRLPSNLMPTAAGMARAVGTAIQRWVLRSHLLRNLLISVGAPSIGWTQIDRSCGAGRAGGFDAVGYAAHTRHTRDDGLGQSPEFEGWHLPGQMGKPAQDAEPDVERQGALVLRQRLQDPGAQLPFDRWVGFGKQHGHHERRGSTRHT